MFLHLDPNKIALPPIIKGPTPHLHHPTTPLPGSHNSDTYVGSLPKTHSSGRPIEQVARNYGVKQWSHGIVNKRV
ncbi:hypothetical protein E4T56_gene16069 [Termitomyces sp. T112]|nr:hypothetical protein E4T56_gene16069 [Termitomyces sp. T112]